MEMSKKFLPYVVARKRVFRLANNIGFFPNVVNFTALGSDCKKIISQPSKNLPFLVNKIVVAIFTVMSLVQFIPLICYITAPRTAKINSLFILETLDIVGGIGLSMYIVYITFLNNGKIVELCNDWASLEMEIIGKMI